MRLSELINQLQSALMDSAELVSRVEEQVIDNALADLSRYRPMKQIATFSLKNGQLLYPGPDDLMNICNVLYGQTQRTNLQPWQEGYPKKLPKLTKIDGDGVTYIQLSHFPDHSIMLSCGREVSYTYYGRRQIKNENITLSPELEPLLLLRCVVEAVKYIMVHQLNKTVSVRNSVAGEAKNGTPAAIHEQLMKQFLQQVKDA